jgi:hypothetical protein
MVGEVVEVEKMLQCDRVCAPHTHTHTHTGHGTGWVPGGTHVIKLSLGTFVHIHTCILHV